MHGSIGGKSDPTVWSVRGYIMLYQPWDTLHILGGSSQLPEAVLVTLLHRFDKAFTLIEDRVDTVRSNLINTDNSRLMFNPQRTSLVREGTFPPVPTKKFIVYMLLILSLNSEMLRDHALMCDTVTDKRMAALQHIYLPNEAIPAAFIDTPALLFHKNGQ